MVKKDKIEKKVEEEATEVIEKEMEKESPETIVFLGAPGSGKDTQAKMLSDALGYQIVSTGELARILAGHNDKVRELLAKGEFLPDSMIEDELISAFVLLPESQPIILDGYPRNLEQAKKLYKILEENNRKVDRVIYINVSEKEAIKRLGKRKICTKCNSISNDIGEKCSQCGGKLMQREDDKLAAIKHRFKIFHERTEPMIDYFRKKNILVEINGNPVEEVVKEEIRKAL